MIEFGIGTAIGALAGWAARARLHPAPAPDAPATDSQRAYLQRLLEQAGRRTATRDKKRDGSVGTGALNETRKRAARRTHEAQEVRHEGPARSLPHPGELRPTRRAARRRLPGGRDDRLLGIQRRHAEEADRESRGHRGRHAHEEQDDTAADVEPRQRSDDQDRGRTAVRKTNRAPGRVRPALLPVVSARASAPDTRRRAHSRFPGAVQCVGKDGL